MMSNLRPGTETGKWALRDATFLQLALYVVFNPVRAAIVKHPVYGVEQLWLDDRYNHGGRIHWLARSYLLH
jgi:hypothetical protein